MWTPQNVKVVEWLSITFFRLLHVAVRQQSDIIWFKTEDLTYVQLNLRDTTSLNLILTFDT